MDHLAVGADRHVGKGEHVCGANGIESDGGEFVT